MRRLLLAVILIAVLVDLRFVLLQNRKLSKSIDDKNSTDPAEEVASIATTQNFELAKLTMMDGFPDVTYASDSEEETKVEEKKGEAGWNYQLASHDDDDSSMGSFVEKTEYLNESFEVDRDRIVSHRTTQERSKEILHGLIDQTKDAYASSKINNSTRSGMNGVSGTILGQFGPMNLVPGKSLGGLDNLGSVDKKSGLLVASKISSASHSLKTVKIPPKDTNTDMLQRVSVISKNKSNIGIVFALKNLRNLTTSTAQLNLLLLQSTRPSHIMSPSWSSARDRELLYVKQEIEKAPVIKNDAGLYAGVFRNISLFGRSYKLMERILKVYVYKEGEKPIFHEPKLRGIYASEGWFMKLMEQNKKFVVRDPRKAHLFYMPFSSQILRATKSEKHGSNSMEQYLERYVELIARKYSFWNRTKGADHFLVACHDWALKVTRHRLSNCIRVLCNANVARGFQVGKDTTLPPTNIRSQEDPSRGIGGRSPSERHILAFFAGGLHGHLRSMLLHHWENKEPDMKIFSTLPRDKEGKNMYTEYMKSSKYCICARGYEVHSPRIVEAIVSECVPVIISDGYVPPFFEVLNWESFALFVPERDVPNLKNVLHSIPEEKYLSLHLGVKMVQNHFLWNKKPVAYDLFHMILHSVWYNRVFQT